MVIYDDSECETEESWLLVDFFVNAMALCTHVVRLCK